MPADSEADPDSRIFSQGQSTKTDSAWPKFGRNGQSPQFRNKQDTLAAHEYSSKAAWSCRSLCIIDEFGKGTLAADGVGLLCGVLQHFSDTKPSPKVIACTHFSEVVNEIYLRRSACTSPIHFSLLSYHDLIPRGCLHAESTHIGILSFAGINLKSRLWAIYTATNLCLTYGYFNPSCYLSRVMLWTVQKTAQKEIWNRNVLEKCKVESRNMNTPVQVSTDIISNNGDTRSTHQRWCRLRGTRQPHLFISTQRRSSCIDW